MRDPWGTYLVSGSFKALVLEQDGKNVSAAIRELTLADLPEGEVTVRVSHSTLNYKDGMVVKGIGRLVRAYPHIPGIDYAGTVEESKSPDFKPGDKVVLTGWRVGEAHWGGYSQVARAKADWLVKLPAGLSPAQAMGIGTAGFTAMLAVMALEEHNVAAPADVLVTGAGGGVGGVAIALLSRLGYKVFAATGRPQERDYLMALGASEIVTREELSQPVTRPLLTERWAGCVDAVGGVVLANVLASIKYGGAVAACGLAGGNDMTGTVIPFLLRGVNLLGIDSVMCPKARREAAWARLARDLPLDRLASITSHAPLSAVPELADKILAGQVRGRVVIDIE